MKAMAAKYRTKTVDGKKVPLHRWLWQEAHGPIPEGMFVAHRNGDRTDNRLENLELKQLKQHHRLSAIDADNRRADCAVCGPGSRICRDRHRKAGWRCSERDLARYRKIRATDLEGDRQRRRQYNEASFDKIQEGRRQRKYNISTADYDALVKAQDGKCPVCSLDLPEGRSGYVDHDHLTGITRGILDRRCNMGLGYFDDDPRVCRAAAEYLDGCPSDIVGVIEIAARLGFPERTVHQWVWRKVLPPADYPNEVNGSQVWTWPTILRWAAVTNRLRAPEAVAAYERLRPALPSELDYKAPAETSA